VVFFLNPDKTDEEPEKDLCVSVIPVTLSGSKV